MGDLVEFRLELTGRLAVDDQPADRVALAREVGSLLSRADAIWCRERDGPVFCHRALDLHRRVGEGKGWGFSFWDSRLNYDTC